MEFSKEDVKRIKALKSVMKMADFSVKGEAVITMGVLFKWFDDFEMRLEKYVESSSNIAKSKEVTEPIKPIGKPKKVDSGNIST